MASDSTSFKPSEPKLCAKGCGFFGSASTRGLCSKCFLQDQLTSSSAALEWISINNEISAPTLAAVPSPAFVPTLAVDEVVPQQERCQECKKRVKIGRGFNCRCGFLFCVLHRYPEVHKCPFDYKTFAKSEIAKANPKVKADKIHKI